jgi:hypothetical protein
MRDGRVAGRRRSALILKVLFLVLLYVFIWRIVRTASRDLRLPQESFVLTPGRRRRRAGRPRAASRPAVSSSSQPSLDTASCACSTRRR